MMTNEEYGRQWAKENGVSPVNGSRYGRFGRWFWQPAVKYPTGNPGGLPEPLVGTLTIVSWDNERKAYEALGKTIRKFHELVPKLKAEALCQCTLPRRHENGQT